MTGGQALARGLVAAGVRLVRGAAGAAEPALLSALAGIYRASVDERIATCLALAGALVSNQSTAVLLGRGGMPRAFETWGSVGLINELESGCVIIDSDPESRPLYSAARIGLLDVSSVDELASATQIGCALSQRMGMPIGVHVAPTLLAGGGNFEVPLVPAALTPAHFSRQSGPFAVGDGESFHLDKRLRRWADLGRWSDMLVEDLGREGKKAVIIAGDLPRSAMARAWARRLPVVRLGMVAPLPEERLVELLRSRDEVLVLERGEPLIARAVKLLCHDRGLACRVVHADQPRQLDDEQIDLALGRFGGRVRAEADPPARETTYFADILATIGSIPDDEREPWPLYLARRRKGAARLGASTADPRRRLLDALHAGSRATTIAASDGNLAALALPDRLVDVVVPPGLTSTVAGGLCIVEPGDRAPLSVALIDERALYAGELIGIVDNALAQRDVLYIVLVARPRTDGLGLNDEQLEGLLRSTGLKVATVALEDPDLAGAVAYAMSRSGPRALLCFGRS